MIVRFLRFLRNPFVLLSTVPACIAIAIGLLPFPLIWLERAWPALGDALPTFSPGTASDLLSVIATASMTALSLAYSLTLIVFTLAAGAVGPRLLKRFTSDSVSQVSAGAFAGTFLYALNCIAFGAPEDRLSLTVLVAILLAAHAVLQLIFFVRHVAQTVSIDDEVAAIADRLTIALGNQRTRYSALDETPDEAAFKTSIEADGPGYVGVIDEDALVRIAVEQDLIARIVARPGGFVAEGEVTVKLSKPVDDDVIARVQEVIRIEPSRSAGCEVEFSIHLLVEIALRALSPGVNDVYTAVAVSDAISGAVADILDRDEAPIGLLDENGDPRLILPGLSIWELVGQAYHPLRSAGRNSILMSQALARAFGRLYVAGDEPVKDTMRLHADLLMLGLAEGGHLKRDIESVVQFLPTGLRPADAEGGEKDGTTATK